MKSFCKGVIAVIGGLASLIILALNIFSNSVINNGEFSKISLYPIAGILINLIIIFLILFISRLYFEKFSTMEKWKKISVMIMIISIYFGIQIAWIYLREAKPAYDQLSIYNAAVTMYTGEFEKFDFPYLQYYPHQLPLASFFSVIFKIFNDTSFTLLQILNAIANTISLIGIIFISKQLGKKYEINKCRALLVGLGFVSLPLLSTFIYGDIISLPFCLWGIYFLMRYREKNNIVFLIISSILMALGYIARNNNVIWIIAAIIYLILSLFEIEERTFKKVFLRISLIVFFSVVTLLPTPIIKKHWQKIIGLNDAFSMPMSFYFCLGINESPHKANGWFENEFVIWAYTSDIKTANEKFVTRINERIEFFKEKPYEMIKFYTLKLVSMWCENTNASLIYNDSWGFTNNEENLEKSQELDKKLYKFETPIILLQKSIVILIFASTILVLLKYRKDISLDVLLLVLIFIGGFLFHIMWEAKSRYIIPYVVVLMPLTSIVTYNFENIIYKKLAVRKYKRRKKEILSKKV